MSIESDADRLDIIQTLAGISTDEITVRHPTGQFDAVFENEFLEVGFGAGVETVQPVLIARTIDVASLVKDTPLEFEDDRGQTQFYRVKHHEPDGTGMSRVLLRR
jgi:hypothetical protein